MIIKEELLNIIKDTDNHYTKYGSYNGKIAVNVDGNAILFLDPDAPENAEILKTMGPMNTPDFNTSTVRKILAKCNGEEFVDGHCIDVVDDATIKDAYGNIRSIPAFVKFGCNSAETDPIIFPEYVHNLFDLFTTEFNIPKEFAVGLPVIVGYDFEDVEAVIYCVTDPRDII